MAPTRLTNCKHPGMLTGHKAILQEWAALGPKPSLSLRRFLDRQARLHSQYFKNWFHASYYEVLLRASSNI